MGRRSVSSTKTGKFMNPTDQARKEARRKELKKNKKQRLIVRHAVIKGKDPKTVLNEMEQLDRMEYDPNNPPAFNVKVLQEKRRKLKETWVKVFKLLEQDDPKAAAEMKYMEVEYEKRRSQLVCIYESIKQAQKVKLEDIPLPDMMPPSMLGSVASTIDIPLPSAAPVYSQQAVSGQKSILKTKSDSKREPPGPPPGPPPNLTEFECDDDEKELGISVDDNLKNKPKKIRFAEDTETSASVTNPSGLSYAAAVMSAPPPSSASQMNYGNVNRMYGQQPPVPMQQQQQQQQSQSSSRSNIPQQSQQNVFSAPPMRSTVTSSQMQAQQIAFADDGRGASLIIEAKPVLRNKMAEITRFVPTAVMVKRDAKTKTTSMHDPYQFNPQSTSNLPPYMSTASASSYQQPPPQQQQQQQKSTKDEAYDLFMKEINKLL